MNTYSGTKILNSSKELSNEIKIILATKNWEKEQIYRFRYKIFKEELAKGLPLVMQKKKKISDDLDNDSLLLYAKSHDSIIGTLRITLSHINDFPEWLTDIFSLKKVAPELEPQQRVGLVTKLAIAPAYRGSTLMYQFLVEFLKLTQEQNVEYVFSGCNPHLISMYERIGFRRFIKINFTDPGYGLLVPIVLITSDLDHFKTVRSPAYRFLRTKNYHASFDSSKFLRIFPDAKEILNSQLISEENLFTYISSRIGASILNNTPIFNKLTIHELKAFFHFGTIFHCSSGDAIISKGELSNELYIIISGTIATESCLLVAGQFFGGGLTKPLLQNDQIIAITDAEILVVSYQSFQKFRQLYHRASGTIIETISDKLYDATYSINQNINMEESI